MDGEPKLGVVFVHWLGEEVGSQGVGAGLQILTQQELHHVHKAHIIPHRSIEFLPPF
jgi:hypothetical protein